MMMLRHGVVVVADSERKQLQAALLRLSISERSFILLALSCYQFGQIMILVVNIPPFRNQTARRSIFAGKV